MARPVLLEEEIGLYVIHGILHLLGFDDRTSKDAQKMRKKEKELLEFLGTGIRKVTLHEIR